MSQASLMAQMVKNLPTMQETLVQSLGQEDPLDAWDCFFNPLQSAFSFLHLLVE